MTVLPTLREWIPGTGGLITRVECQVWPQFVQSQPLLESFSASFEWLAAVDMESLFTQRAYHLKSVPDRSAIRIALTEIDEGRTQDAFSRTSRGWKLFLLLPRLLLHRPPRGEERFPRSSCNAALRVSHVESGLHCWSVLRRAHQAEHRRSPVGGASLAMTLESRAAKGRGVGANGRTFRQRVRPLKVQRWLLGTTPR